jgi:hypothetical protein
MKAPRAPSVNLAIALFGYQNHVSIDRRFASSADGQPKMPLPMRAVVCAKAATIWLRNPVAAHDTKRDVICGPAKIFKENKTVQKNHFTIIILLRSWLTSTAAITTRPLMTNWVY